MSTLKSLLQSCFSFPTVIDDGNRFLVGSIVQLAAARLVRVTCGILEAMLLAPLSAPAPLPENAIESPCNAHSSR